MPGPKTKNQPQTLSYCADIVREYDPDRYFITMMMPHDMREDILALLAFNHEIAKTREVVSETMLGQIRLKWWIEAIAEIYESGAVLEHEILQALAKAIERRGLRYEYFETLVHAREFDLEDVLPAHLEGLAHYCDFTLTPLLRLIMQVMGDDPETGMDAPQAVALNAALIGLVRAVPFHAAQRRCYMPEDLMAKHAQSKYALFEGKIAAEFPQVVEAVLSPYIDDLKPQNLYLKALHSLAQIYFRQLKSAGFDPFSVKMRLDPPFKALRLYSSVKFL
ncbi:MAG: phytoene/squalene synthase family protein [Alphaproteobacteria bacterium]